MHGLTRYTTTEWRLNVRILLTTVPYKAGFKEQLFEIQIVDRYFF